MKNKIEVEKVKIVTKDNFQSELKEFKDLLNSTLFEYIIINNDISTSCSSPNKQNQREIIFSEFTICRKLNLQSKDIEYTFTTFLVPSLKFHRFQNDEIVSFSSIFLKYLTNEKSVYDFNLINATKTLSYDNIHKRPEFEKTLNKILLDGKPSKKENKASYQYYPKAFNMPSKKFRKKFEECLKYFVSQIFEENIEKEKYDEQTWLYKNDKYYISDFKLLEVFLNFKWGQIFDKIDNEIYKVFVNGFKIKFKNKDIGNISTFLDFVKRLQAFLEDSKNISYNFEIDLKDNNENTLNEDILENWKKVLLAEENILEFKYEFIDENKINCNIKADKAKENRKFENIKKFIDAIISIPDEIKDKDEIEIKPIFFRRINMKNLFPEKIKNNLDFYYHPVAKVNPSKLKEITEGNNLNYYLKKVSYEDLFLKKKNDEEILFGYRFEPQLKQLYEIKRDVPQTRTISLEFGKDIEILLNDKRFCEIMNSSFSEFKIEKEDKSSNNRTMHLNLRSDINFQKEKSKIINIVKDIKKNLLLDEEIGVAFFYDEIFKKEGINVYGTNLKNKLYFAIEDLILKSEEKNEENVKKIIDKINVYDISYICCKKNIDFYRKYITIKKQEECKERTMTQRLGYVIEETPVLKNEEDLKDLKNTFYLDLDNNKQSIKCKKEKFYDNVNEIFRIIKNKSDFIVNRGKNDNNIFELSLIDKEKFNAIDDISKEINGIIS